MAKSSIPDRSSSRLERSARRIAAKGNRTAGRASGRSATRDVETRQRVLDAARRLFAERGFHKVTVREITQEARANIAAVSYHFRDKLGLYTEVIELAVADARQQLEVSRAPEGTPPAERLRLYVKTSLERMAAQPQGRSLVQSLMQHEMMNPTPAMGWFVEQASAARFRYLAEIVSECTGLPVSDRRVGLHVASIHSQFVFHVKSPFRDAAFKSWHLDGVSREDLADHIVTFTLGGLGAISSRKR